jgi:hypothetical protein
LEEVRRDTHPLEEVHHDIHLLEEAPQAADRRQLCREEARKVVGAPPFEVPLLEEPIVVAQIQAQLPGAVKLEGPVW